MSDELNFQIPRKISHYTRSIRAHIDTHHRSKAHILTTSSVTPQGSATLIMAFKYVALKEGEFRLLRLQPSSTLTIEATTEIECDLVVFDRRECPSYESLSYTWGDPLPVRFIYIGGNKIKVQENLYNALQHLRQQKEDRFIWIDALCINQGDEVEKGSQVGLMTETYASSKNTIVWLGLQDETSDFFLENANKIGHDLNKDRLVKYESENQVKEITFHKLFLEYAAISGTPENQDRQKYLESIVNKELEGYFRQAEDDLPRTVCLLQALKSVLDRPYWNRAWIRQEFVVSPNITIQSGHSKIEGAELHITLLYLIHMKTVLMVRLVAKMQEYLETASPYCRRELNAWAVAGFPEVTQDWKATEPELYETMIVCSHFNRIGGIEISQSTNSLFGMKLRYQRYVEGKAKMAIERKDPSSNYANKNTTGSQKAGPDTTEFNLIEVLAKVYIGSTVLATEQKDRVFALLSMASDRKDLEALGLRCEYDETASVGDIYTKAARVLIQGGNLDVLAFAQHRKAVTTKAEEPLKDQEHQQEPAKGEEKEKPVPSWVPDWREEILRPCGQQPWHTFFNVSGELKYKETPGFSSCLPREIELSGWTIDTISSVGKVWQPTEDDYDKDFGRILRWLTDISEYCKMSDLKFQQTGRDVYVKDQEKYRASAHYLIPIADQQQYGLGFIKKATPETELLYLEVFEKLSRDTMSDPSNKYLNMMGWQRDRGLFLSEKGYVGLAPHTVLFGDKVVVFEGAKFPYILRKSPKKPKEEVSTEQEGTAQEVSKYTLVGEAYVHGIMYGEFAEQAKQSEKEVFRLE